MPKLVANKKRELSEATLPDYLAHYIAEKNMLDELTKRVNGMKATMMAYLEEHGIENEKGHRVIVVDGVATIVREQRISEAFLEDVAERWLKRKGKRDDIIKPVVVEEWDMDAFFALLFEDKTPPATVDTFYERNPIYAFKVTGRAK